VLGRPLDREPRPERRYTGRLEDRAPQECDPSASPAADGRGPGGVSPPGPFSNPQPAGGTDALNSGVWGGAPRSLFFLYSLRPNFVTNEQQCAKNYPLDWEKSLK